MTSENNTWQKVEVLFAKLIDQPVNRREELAEQYCQGNDALLTELKSLLSAYKDTDGFLEKIDSAKATALVQEVVSHVPEDFIGPYQATKEIGRGGMGVVYLAKRADGQFDQTVALKLVKWGIENDDVRKRFLNERQILSQLQHPNIARLLDGGITDQGQPYFAMEYIDGSNLLDYCDEHRLSINERLKLFSKVCDAIQYAHQNLIIHRDLKPSNILVTKDREVKLVDFGIAKLLETDNNLSIHLQTIADIHAYTPNYAAPEQIRGETITTATDIYSLGVVLYELLCGLRPYHTPTDSLQKIVELVCEKEPPRMSGNLANTTQDRLDTSGNTIKSPSAEEICKRRNISYRRFSKILKGDIEKITRMALRKEPERRYASAQNLNTDIQNFIKGFPILARNNTFVYLAQKFVMRHKIATISSLFIIVTIFVTFSIANHHSQLAKQEAEKANAVSIFLQEVLTTIDPNREDGKNKITVQLLDAMETQLSNNQSLTNQPESEASIRLTLGKLYLKHGVYNKAEVQLTQAITLSKKTLGAEHQSTLTAENSLLDLHRKKSNYTEAVQLAEQTLEVEIRVLGETHLQTLKTKTKLATVYRNLGNHDKAEKLYFEILAVYKSKYSSDDHSEKVLGLLNLIANLKRRQGQFDDALKYAIEATSGIKRLLGERDQKTLWSVYNLSLIYRKLGQYQHALNLSLELQKLQKLVLGPKHIEYLRNNVHLAVIYLRLGHHNKALQMAQDSLVTLNSIYGGKNSVTLLARTTLARAKVEMLNFEQAFSTFGDLLFLQSTILGEHHRHSLTIKRNIAYTHTKVGNYDEAEMIYPDLLQQHKEHLGTNHPGTLRVILGIAYLNRKLKKHEDNVLLLVSTLRNFENLLSPSHPLVLKGKSRLAQSYESIGELDKAKKLYDDTLFTADSRFGKDSAISLSIRTKLARYFRKRGQTKKSIAVYSNIVKTYETNFSPQHPKGLFAKEKLADVYRQNDEYNKARKLYTELLETRTTLYSHAHRVIKRTKWKLKKLERSK